MQRLKLVAGQGHLLYQLFEPLEYTLDSQYDDFQGVFDPVGSAKPVSKKISTLLLLREVIATFIDVTSEPATVPVHREILQSALNFSADSQEAIAGVLYPGNRRLGAEAAQAVKLRIFAAWHTLVVRYSAEQVAADPVLRDECRQIYTRLSKYSGKSDSLQRKIDEYKEKIAAAAKSEDK